MKKLLILVGISLNFLISQSILSVEPNSAVQGASLWVTITGEDTYFVVTDTVGAPSNVEAVMITMGNDMISATSFTPESRTVLNAMFVIPAAASIGSYDVTVDHGTVAGTDYPTVLLVNGFTIAEPVSPSEFSLLTPEDASTVTIDESNYLTGSTEATWESSSESGRTITYTIEHNTNIGILPFIPTEVSTNSITIVFSEILSEINAYLLLYPLSGVTSLNVTWNVTATNEAGSTSSTNGPYSFTLDATSYLLGVDSENNNVPRSYALNQNYPNPFNPSTNISFKIANSSVSSLTIYDVSGNLVRELKNGFMPEGEYNLTWDGRSATGQSVASGLYIYQLKSNSYIATKKMLMIK
jgi:hypothetical protein